MDKAYVLCNPLAAPPIQMPCDQTSGELLFNGNDVVELVCNDAGSPTVMDVIGQIGSSEFWSSGGATTVNQTLRRLCSVGGGDTNGFDPFFPDVEWTSFPEDTFDDLGHYVCP